MTNLVLYRKYRPQKFLEIIGQDHIVRTLTNALILNQVSHAYLFSGPRGTGKTTIARLLAKAVNCVNSQLSQPKAGLPRAENVKCRQVEPCNKCMSCEEIMQGKSLDLIEIDAASNRGIDEVRELREMTRFSPVKSQYKVFVIDECHMLTKEAFNALLKTLEEPPSHAIFILATTEVHKVPETIISRCQRFDFRKLNLNDLVSRLDSICQKEKVDIDKEALKLIALTSDGSARDSESLLSQIISFKEGQITKKDVEEILGAVDIRIIAEFVDYLTLRNSNQAFQLITRITDGGYDLEEFAKSLVSYLRELLIIKIAPDLINETSSGLTPDQLERLREGAQKFSEDELKKLIGLFTQAQNDLRRSSLPQLPLELAVVEFVHS